MRLMVVAALLMIATSAAAQGIVPMTPAQWGQARQTGIRGDIPANTPIMAKLLAVNRSGDGHAAIGITRQVESAPFVFRLLSPYVQAAEAAQDRTKAAQMARGVASPETMVVIVQVNSSPVPTAPLVNIQDVVIQRGSRLFKPIAKSFDDVTVGRNGTRVPAVEGVCSFLVEAFLATRPIRMLFYGSGGVAMGWDMTVADLLLLK